MIHTVYTEEGLKKITSKEHKELISNSLKEFWKPDDKRKERSRIFKESWSKRDRRAFGEKMRQVSPRIWKTRRENEAKNSINA